MSTDGLPTTHPEPLAGIQKLQPYQPGTKGGPANAEPALLSQNEAALGPSPAALACLHAASPDAVSRYPDPSLLELREAIGLRYGIDPARILCGAGSEGLLHLIARCYLRAGDEVLFSERAFAMYPLVTRAADAVPVPVPEGPAFALQVDEFLARVSSRTRLVLLANPNNPTGARLGPDEVRRLHAGLPRSTLLVLDAAYQDYETAPQYTPGFELVEPERGDVLVLGTFSKALGLAGLRLGWAFSSRPVIDILGRVRPVFSVPGITAQAAVAAIGDAAHVAREIAHVRRYRPWLEAELRRIGCEVPSASGNFAVATLPPGPFTGPEAHQYLAHRGIHVRPLGNYALPRTLRISVGTEAAMARCIAALQQYLSSPR